MSSLLNELVFIYFTVVFCIVSSSKPEVDTYYVDEGNNLTLSCPTSNGPVTWIREGRKDQSLQEVLVSAYEQFSNNLSLFNIS